jgi:RNA recognition motif-containing protein
LPQGGGKAAKFVDLTTLNPRHNQLITLFVRGLPKSTTENGLTALFSQYGVVRSFKMVRDIFTGDCRGFATIDMEGHEARAAISALDNSDFNGSLIRVSLDRPKKGRAGKRR